MNVGTLGRLRRLRSTLIDPTIDEHGGFDSVDGAVRCAMKVQQELPDCDHDEAPDRAIRFRVGINAGDVIPEGTDVHGDVVNVAARLQAACPPGGICVSRAMREPAGSGRRSRREATSDPLKSRTRLPLHRFRGCATDCGSPVFAITPTRTSILACRLMTYCTPTMRLRRRPPCLVHGQFARLTWPHWWTSASRSCLTRILGQVVPGAVGLRGGGIGRERGNDRRQREDAMQEGARGMRLAIAGYERVMEGADMRASVLTLAAGECVPWHYHQPSPTASSVWKDRWRWRPVRRAPSSPRRWAALRGGPEDRAHGARGGWWALPVPADARRRGVQQCGGWLGADPGVRLRWCRRKWGAR